MESLKVTLITSSEKTFPVSVLETYEIGNYSEQQKNCIPAQKKF